MKKIPFILILFCCFLANAQTSHNQGNRPPQHRATEMVMRAQHDEQFVIYVDGDIINRTPQNYVTFQLLAGQHDIYVVLKRPTDKITMFNYQAQSLKQELMVSLNPQTHQLDILDMTPVAHGHQPAYGNHPSPPVLTQMACSDNDLRQMINTLKKESFDDKKLQLAQPMLNRNRFTVQQIRQLVQVFSFDDKKLEFFKRAFPACIDQGNYYQCVEDLTFSSNKDELLKFIQ